MKKFNKAFLATLAVIPCAFGFVACGGNGGSGLPQETIVEVGAKEDYQTSSLAEVQVILDRDYAGVTTSMDKFEIYYTSENRHMYYTWDERLVEGFAGTIYDGVVNVVEGETNFVGTHGETYTEGRKPMYDDYVVANGYIYSIAPDGTPGMIGFAEGDFVYIDFETLAPMLDAGDTIRTNTAEEGKFIIEVTTNSEKFADFAGFTNNYNTSYETEYGDAVMCFVYEDGAFAGASLTMELDFNENEAEGGNIQISAQMKPTTKINEINV